MKNSFRSILGLLLCATIIVAAAYWPGLKGGFIFDDAANLPSLGSNGPIDNWAAFLRYITSGKADPIGRPISLLTFLIDGNDWPADAFPFKRTNLIIHLLNGFLLFLTLRRLGRHISKDNNRSDITALIASCLWLAHPLFVSTVLYAVQREAMLPATFTLLGILAWLSIRDRLERKQRLPAWLILAPIAATGLATLSKANGILLPSIILVIELSLPTKINLNPYRKKILLITGIPTFLLLAGLIGIAFASAGAPPIPIRGWTIGQRLLTEPRILLDYLAQLWMIKPVDGSVFQDDQAVARNWLSPWWVLPASVTCIGLITFTLAIRRKYPHLAIALGVFFCGHLLESTSIPLELYFEHRNYLPALAMFWPVGWALAGSRLAWWRMSVSLIAFALLVTLTWSYAKVWGSPLSQAEDWALNHPLSPRAQAYASRLEADYGQGAQALQRIDNARSIFGPDLQIASNLVILHCELGVLQESDMDYAIQSVRAIVRDPGSLLSDWLFHLIDHMNRGNCANLKPEDVKQLVTAAWANESLNTIAGRRQDIAHIEGYLLLQEGKIHAARGWFIKALQAYPTPQAALNEAALLGTHDYPELGLQHLDLFDSLSRVSAPLEPLGMRRVHEMILAWQGFWPIEVAHLRRSLNNDLRKKTHAE